MAVKIIDALATDRASTDPKAPLELVEWSEESGRIAFPSMLARATRRARQDGRAAPTLIALDALRDLTAEVYRTDAAARELVDQVYAGRSQPIHPKARRVDSAKLRQDGIELTSGLLFARDLEHIHARVSEEPVATLNALALFGVSSEVPVGATSHTVRRFGDAGQARMYRAGEEVPTVSLAAVEESFGIGHLVAGLEIDFFEALAHGFAGLREYERKLRAVRRAIDRLLNRIAWWGSREFKLYGFLNYPHLPKRVFATPLIVPTSIAQFDAILAGFNEIANRARQAHKDTADPNRCATSTRVRDYMAQTRHPQGRESLLELFLRDQARISRVDSAWELQESGPGGTDHFLLWDDTDPDAKPSVEVIQGFATLPMETRGFAQRQVGYATTGGMVIRDVRAASITFLEVNF